MSFALVGLAAVPAVVGYAWVATGLRPFTVPSLVATVAGGLVAIVVGGRLSSSAANAWSPAVGGGWVWAALAAAGGIWQLQAFFQHPRRDHPTISSLTNELLQSHTSRTAAMVVWLAAGVWLARR